MAVGDPQEAPSGPKEALEDAPALRGPPAEPKAEEPAEGGVGDDDDTAVLAVFSEYRARSVERIPMLASHAPPHPGRVSEAASLRCVYFLGARTGCGPGALTALPYAGGASSPGLGLRDWVEGWPGPHPCGTAILVPGSPSAGARTAGGGAPYLCSAPHRATRPPPLQPPPQRRRLARRRLSSVGLAGLDPGVAAPVQTAGRGRAARVCAPRAVAAQRRAGRLLPGRRRRWVGREGWDGRLAGAGRRCLLPRHQTSPTSPPPSLPRRGQGAPDRGYHA